MKQLQISVVIPVFNASKFLHKAIESALHQSYKPYEILVVDDGSSDSSVEIARSFGESVRVLEQPNRGPSAARNLGTQVASGNWIAFLDADDYWLPNKLELQVELAQSDPAIGFIYTGRREFWGNRILREVKAQHPDWLHKQLVYENPIFPSTVLARRDLLLAHPWPEQFRSSEDWWMFYKLSRETKFARIEQVTTMYRVNPESLTHADWRPVFEQASVVAECIQQEHQGVEKYLLRRRVYSRLYANAAVAAREDGSTQCMGLMLKSLASWPFPDVWPRRYKILLKMLQRRITNAFPAHTGHASASRG